MHLGVDFYAVQVYSWHCQKELTHNNIYTTSRKDVYRTKTNF